jgi:hypothetical protein
MADLKALIAAKDAIERSIDEKTTLLKQVLTLLHACLIIASSRACRETR